MRKFHIVLWSLGLTLWVSSSALAQMTGNIDRLKADLHGVDTDRAVAAASALGSLKDTRARDALIGALTLGATPKLLTAMIEALGQQKDPQSFSMLSKYCSHRNVKVRTVALDAINIHPSINKSNKLLMRKLSDSHPMIRAKAARFLGDRKVKGAKKLFFAMLKRGDKSAATPLGKIGGMETAKRLAEMVGDIDNDSIASALGEMLKRSDFGPDPLKLQVVKTVCKIPGVGSTAALAEYVATQKSVTISKRIAEQCIAQRQK